jgi:hypothetical protein
MSQHQYVTVARSTVHDPRNDLPAGTETLHAGKADNADPEYRVVLDSGEIKLIKHEIVEEVKAPREMSAEEIKDWYIEDYFLRQGGER